MFPVIVGRDDKKEVQVERVKDELRLMEPVTWGNKAFPSRSVIKNIQRGSDDLDLSKEALHESKNKLFLHLQGGDN